jgi:hypothetical protein
VAVGARPFATVILLAAAFAELTLTAEQGATPGFGEGGYGEGGFGGVPDSSSSP